MKLTLISSLGKLEGEAELLTALFQKGLHSYHLRKYDLTETEVIELTRKIPAEFHDRIMLHHHHYHMKSFMIKGLHFNRFHKDIGNIEKGRLVFSRSAHSLEELGNIEDSIDYVLLSPIYQSLSKETHEGLLDKKTVRDHLKTHDHPFEVFAMSGVTKEKLPELHEIGFEGAAISGALWNIFVKQGQDATIQAFESINETAHECS